jgi:hypothetical protein
VVPNTGCRGQAAGHPVLFWFGSAACPFHEKAFHEKASVNGRRGGRRTELPLAILPFALSAWRRVHAEVRLLLRSCHLNRDLARSRGVSQSPRDEAGELALPFDSGSYAACARCAFRSGS